jgi:hypothetical protein
MVGSQLLLDLTVTAWLKSEAQSMSIVGLMCMGTCMAEPCSCQVGFQRCNAVVTAVQVLLRLLHVVLQRQHIAAQLQHCCCRQLQPPFQSPARQHSIDMWQALWCGCSTWKLNGTPDMSCEGVHRQLETSSRGDQHGRVH